MASLAAASAAAEVVYLNNGDAIHGTLVAANNTQVTLKTPYGELIIPKKDIARIDYDESRAPSASGKPGATSPSSGAPDSPAPARKTSERATITLKIQGRSFWYAFDSPPGLSVDPSLRLRFYIGSDRACTFVDDKPDTVDGVTLYNSFTFSPTDSRLLESLEGYDCKVEKAQDGAVVLRVTLRPSASSGVQSVRMLYEVNEGDKSSPRWLDAVARSFSIQVAPGKEAVAVLEQNADALEYTGLFKKKMKNVELFQMSLLSTELKD
ncbi:MAG: hypothetical protein ACRD1Z_17105 [Vicinamibacteria bacterium]